MNVEDDAPKGKVNTTAIERIQTIQKEKEELSERLQKASAMQKHYYDKRHKKIEFCIKDQVMLATKNLRRLRPSKKLSDRYLGPFEVIEVIGKHRQAYRLKLEPEYKFYDVFHVSLLEPWHGRAETVAKLPSIEIDGYEE